MLQVHVDYLEYALDVLDLLNHFVLILPFRYVPIHTHFINLVSAPTPMAIHKAHILSIKWRDKVRSLGT